ncbi:hypothetical protein, partial [Listeria monocytogenes]|uniref:hypothetical protein n=1 Tax=Listeria monocytogenes TaxID=1639 RepID=UPI002FDBAD06
AVGIRPEQVAWIERRVRHGGRVFIAIREIRPANRLHIALDFLHFYRGEKVRELKDKGLKCKGYYFMCIGGPKEWNWDIIGRSLLDKKL